MVDQEVEAICDYANRLEPVDQTEANQLNNASSPKRSA